MSRQRHPVKKALRHKSYGMTHPTWDQPSNFFYDTEGEAWAAIDRIYGPDSGHLVVGILTRVSSPAESLGAES